MLLKSGYTAGGGCTRTWGARDEAVGDRLYSQVHRVVLVLLTAAHAIDTSVLFNASRMRVH